MSLRIFVIPNVVSSFFLTNTKGGQSNNIEESTVMSLFASGYETKVSAQFV